MFDKLRAPERPPSKESILKQADGLHDLARRARRLAGSASTEGDRHRLGHFAEELDENAARLERSAAEAKTG